MRTTSSLVALTLAGPVPAADPLPPAADRPVDFGRDVLPILTDHCFACHGPDDKARKADLRLDTRDAAIKAEAFVPGKPAESELVRRVTSTEAGEVMPPAKTGKKLSKAETDILTRWVKDGAAWPSAGETRPVAKDGGFKVTPQDRAFWSFRPIADPPPPG